MSGYYEPLTPDEYAQVYDIARTNLRDLEVDAPGDYDPFGDVLDYTVEDCESGELWHLPRHQIESVVRSVIADCQA